MLVDSKEQDRVDLNISNRHCHHPDDDDDYEYDDDDDDLLVIYEEEEGVVCHKLGVDQWSGRPEPDIAQYYISLLSGT